MENKINKYIKNINDTKTIVFNHYVILTSFIERRDNNLIIIRGPNK